VIVVTSGGSPDEHERAVRAGADGVISKPLCRVSLLQVVQRFLRLTARSFERVAFETEVRLSANGPTSGAGLATCRAAGCSWRRSRC
jgi:DNA-binding response OmpR family regulator